MGIKAALTPEDVALLRFVADCNDRDNIALFHERDDDPNGDKAIASLLELADRIEALLPPKDDGTAHSTSTMTYDD